MFQLPFPEGDTLMRKITFYFLLCLCSVEQVFAATQADTVVSSAVQARINENYGKLPLRFEVNEGQADGSAT